MVSVGEVIAALGDFKWQKHEPCHLIPDEARRRMTVVFSRGGHLLSEEADYDPNWTAEQAVEAIYKCLAEKAALTAKLSGSSALYAPMGTWPLPTS